MPWQRREDVNVDEVDVLSRFICVESVMLTRLCRLMSKRSSEVGRARVEVVLVAPFARARCFSRFVRDMRSFWVIALRALSFGRMLDREFV